jgi:hypothetical protein
MKPDEITLSLASSPPSVASGVSELMGWWEVIK